MLVTRLIAYYILWTIRLGISPWRYFQLNAQYFNTQKKIFSKLEIDQHIPSKWRLPQAYLDINNPPIQYPVFLKPEWGQNSYGIQVVYCQTEYLKACKALKNKKVPYIAQALAKGNQEYEIFYIQHPDNDQDCITLTITEVVNAKEQYPINAIYNKHTHYRECTEQFDTKALQTIKAHLALFPCFAIARLALKTDNQASLIAGNFSVIEINLFTPMPLNLLDIKHSKQHKIKFIKKNMEYLAKLSGKIPKKKFKRFIFFKKVWRHYQIK